MARRLTVPLKTRRPGRPRRRCVCGSKAVTCTIRALITQRSRVQIPPPLPISGSVPRGEPSLNGFWFEPAKETHRKSFAHPLKLSFR